MKRPLALFLVLAGLALSAPALSADPESKAEPRSSFRLDYVLYELEGGKRTNERTFSMTVIEGHQGQLRSGSRVPIVAGDKGIQYQEVGLKVVARVLERDRDVTLDTELELSTFALPDQANEPKGSPVFRTVGQTLSSRPALGKPALLSTLDDPASRERLQLEVTVTRLR